MKKNYFEELKEKGINEIELSAKEIQDLLKEDRITVDQARNCFIQIVGESKFYEIFNQSLSEYFKEP